ncbi:MAG: adenosylcobalamin-dependent ribonucleoside-diphosphate reductase [Chloroflexi bacterium]|nr:adenosylcobalamin-dependent ribonucleoside-diphosphate reductase [Chloroflexota bacterium]
MLNVKKTTKTKLNGNGSNNGHGAADSAPDLPAKNIQLTDNARVVLEKRYLRRGDDGKPVESIKEMFWRVAYNVALAENEWGGDVQSAAESFFDLLTDLNFFPNSPTFTGAGTPLGQLAACFVLKIEDDMGRSEAGIFQTLRDAALIQQTGGGNGFSFSRLRPKKTLVRSSAGEATGPVGFLRVYDNAFAEIAQGGTRRGANMAVLRVDHPDIEDFITCKTNENAITNFNISVGITDAFMRAVEADADWELRFMDVLSPAWKKFQAHHNGEPGILFLDAANRSNPVPHLYPLEATNPCGEQYLGPYENCCLGSINLARHVTPDGKVDWEKLRQSTVTSTRFLDDVVTANKYVPAVPQLQKAAYAARRIGLGIMGLGDMMYRAGIRYGSDEAQEFSAQIMEFVRYHCMLTGVELAKERGSFLAIEDSMYDPKNLKWTPPQPLQPYTHNYQRPALNWNHITESIKKHGIRNACQTTVAPTGTIATVAGCESYGCEPVFALAYIRHVNDKGQDLKLTYASPMFEQALIKAGISEEKRKEIVEQVMHDGTCQNGSREKVVLETHATAKAKEPKSESPQPIPMFHESKKPRPKMLRGETFQIESPMGKSYVTINRNGGEEPFEVFINTGKAGSEIFAVSEAIGRLISYALRLASPVSPRERLAEIVRQLNGIGGGRPMGFGPNRVLSLPDAVGRALSAYLNIEDQTIAQVEPQPESKQMVMKIGDLCPSCGEAAMVNEEGCRKCYACGHSEC